MPNNIKRLLALSVSAGAGHVRAAQAVCDAAAADPAWRAEHIDVMDWVPRAFRKAYSDSYIQLIESAPLLWAHLYARTDRRTRQSRFDQLRRGVERVNTRAVMAEIERRAPDAILCTHFLPAELLARRIRKGRPTPPVIVQVTDFDVHGLWVHDGMTKYCVAGDEARARLMARGIAPESVVVTGIPIAPAFAHAPERRAARSEAGLALDKPVVLMMSGGAGVGDMKSLVQQVLASGIECQIVAMTGKNAELLAELQSLAAAHPKRVFPIGFTRTIERLMAAADIAVTKPGGLTSSECLAMHLPMIVVSPIPGQEERNADFLLESGAALKAVDAAALVHKLGALLAQPARLKAMRAAAAAIARPQAASEVLQVIACASGVARQRVTK
jgi:processive 1,2-diacylglycerol beta-glucosyltransferase